MKQKFSIEGMSCDDCVARVEKAINELPGIQKVKVHLKRRTVQLNLMKDKSIVNRLQKKLTILDIKLKQFKVKK